ncbi:hypothetical protein C0995_005266 [Termitomyces sp. Mi166|nr:hypothetical protein C0995_005266 [Termitomyces sp. Mi166\
MQFRALVFFVLAFIFGQFGSTLAAPIVTGRDAGFGGSLVASATAASDAVAASITAVAGGLDKAKGGIVEIAGKIPTSADNQL